MLSRLLLVGSFAVGCASVAGAVTLYDASSLDMPHEAPWAWSLEGLGASVSGPTGGSHFSNFDSTASLLGQQGWLQLSPMALDNSVGYDITSDVRLNEETHSDADRAGLAVIAIGTDKKGIELSFWTDEVWAQNDSPLFTKGEGAAFDTTAVGTGVGGLQRYRLHVSGNAYTLFAEGSLLFGGSLRDYSAFAGIPDPYETPNFLFVGDDTTSANADFDFSYFEVATVPEPATMAALGLGVLAMRRRLISRSANKRGTFPSLK